MDSRKESGQADVQKLEDVRFSAAMLNAGADAILEAQISQLAPHTSLQCLLEAMIQAQRIDSDNSKQQHQTRE